MQRKVEVLHIRLRKGKANGRFRLTRWFVFCDRAKLIEYKLASLSAYDIKSDTSDIVTGLIQSPNHDGQRTRIRESHFDECLSGTSA